MFIRFHGDDVAEGYVFVIILLMGQSLDKEISFFRDLLKGKIAEVIFEQMFRDCGKFTILPFGYEKTVPEVA
ncbi:MAG: hypothetical protein KGL39_02265 [Patescibacteria group bacterium]|nr:hypothetical protein [Patescibacteria group bacterium]